MWRESTFEAVACSSEYVDLLKTYLPGYVYFKGFRFSDNSHMGYYIRRGELPIVDFTKRFFHSKTVLKTFTRLDEDGLAVSPFTRKSDPNLDKVKRSELLEDLTELLLQGRSRGSLYTGTQEVAETIAQELLDTLIQRYQGVKDYHACYRSGSAWNGWFNNYHNSPTFIVYSLGMNTLWMLAYTDPV